MDTTTWAIVGYVAAGFGVAGTALLMEKDKFGWIAGIVSSVIFIAYAIGEGVQSFVVVQFLSIFFSILGVIKWQKSGKKKHLKKHKRRR